MKRPALGRDVQPDWVWVWVWVAQGWPKRGPRAMQGWRKGETEEAALFATKDGKRPGGGGRAERAYRRHRASSS